MFFKHFYTNIDKIVEQFFYQKTLPINKCEVNLKENKLKNLLSKTDINVEKHFCLLSN